MLKIIFNFFRQIIYNNFRGYACTVGGNTNLQFKRRNPNEPDMRISISEMLMKDSDYLNGG